MKRMKKIPSLPTWFGAAFSLVVLVLVLVLNTWASLDGVVNNTISAWVTYGASVMAGIPFGLGGVLGHWASRGQNLPSVPGGPIPFCIVVGVLLAGDLLSKGQLARYPFWIWMLLGIGYGAMLWPMNEVAT